MKNKILTIALCVLSCYQQVAAEAISFAVPKQCLADKSSLVLVMRDDYGNECVGTCQLDEQFATRKILKEDLAIRSEAMFSKLPDTIDITQTGKAHEHEIMLHVEFDKDLQVVKVLLIKDNLLADHPFDVISIEVNKLKNVIQEEEDEFSALLDDVDTDVVDAIEAPKLTTLQTCKIYLQVAFAMQYSLAKRKMSNLKSWFSN